MLPQVPWVYFRALGWGREGDGKEGQGRKGSEERK